jgi:peptidoglycan/xylan/chitin deacetylase (PgdA/CDA1 family)
VGDDVQNRVIISLVATILLAVMGYFIFHEDSNYRSQKATNSLILQTERFSVNINFPSTENNDFNNVILEMINSELESFKEIVSESDNIEFKYELNIEYTLFYNGDLTTIEFQIYRFLHDDIIEDIAVFYYDSVQDVEVLWDKLFIDIDLGIERLTNLSHVGLNEKRLFRQLTQSKETFEHLVFDENNIILTLSDNTILEFDYPTLNEFLIYKGGNGSVSNDDSAWTLPVIDRKLRDVGQFKNKKLLLLTFDDGPSGSVTSRLLDELAKRDVRVTFFVLGERINKYPDIIIRAHTDGHTIANHGFSHRSFLSINHSEVINEINTTNKLITNLIRTENRYVRPPYGITDDSVFNISNISFILWSIDPQDWKFRNANTVYANIMRDAHDGGIVVLHDLYPSTVDGAIRAIDALLAQGYALISLEEAEAMGYLNVKSSTTHRLLR